MRIAIAHPHPAPLALGGAENLFWGLQDALRAAGHDCDFVGQVSPERSLREVLESYLAFARLDLSAYDCVISGKYPAWMAPHRDHRLYMLHRLRGLYDAYRGQPIPPELAALPEVESIRQGPRGDAINADPGTILSAVDRFLSRDPASLPPGALDYPGPLARAFVQALDGAALNRGRIRRFAAISATVARRRDYFPADASVDVLHPPPHRSDYRCGRADYFFTSSRLDGPKRIALLIEAMAQVSADVPLLIAGTGPERERLEALAGGDRRIRFLGFVPDADMPALYADALAVPFVPLDEDLGLVTLEAMRSGKPVLTTTDAGGPTEFVRDGSTGILCAPDPASVAAGLDRLAANREDARRMGENAREATDSITWERVVEGLMGPQGRRRPRSTRRRKIVLATTLPIYPPQGGGQARVFHLYSKVARSFDVTILSFGHPHGEMEIAPGLTEIRYGKSPEHGRFERRLIEATGGIPTGDVAMPRLSVLSPQYRAALREAARDADALIACHPYLIGELEAVSRGQPLWYEAQDVELSLKRDVFKDYEGKDVILADVAAVEERCWREAALVFGCTQRDLDELHALYGPTDAVVIEVPNGVALDETPFTAPAERRARQQALGLEGRRTALFLGSWHPPNLDAVAFILRLAEECPETDFLIVGSAGHPFRDKPLPANVRLLGLVSMAVRNRLLASVDIGLNPMTYGSGSNLKMLDYFAAGLPVVTTPFGARGFAVADGEHALIRPLEGFAAAISALGDDAATGRMVMNAYDLVRSRYSWDSVADRLVETIITRDLFRRRRPGGPAEAAA